MVAPAHNTDSSDFTLRQEITCQDSRNDSSTVIVRVQRYKTVSKRLYHKADLPVTSSSAAFESHYQAMVVICVPCFLDFTYPVLLIKFIVISYSHGNTPRSCPHGRRRLLRDFYVSAVSFVRKKRSKSSHIHHLYRLDATPKIMKQRPFRS